MRNISHIGNSCVGCGSCANVCGFNAIEMRPDSAGFLKPLIDDDKCINCGRCIRACPLSIDRERSVPRKVFIAKAADEEKRLSSPSGAVFTIAAEQVLRNNGVVYGAAWNSDFSVSHLRAETRNELEKIRGSKYVQSNLSCVLRFIRDDLDENRKVLFAGTPCQVAAVRAFLGKEYQNLLTIAIMCHSVTSPDTWKWYLEDLSRISHSQIVRVNFRDKRDVSQGPLMSIEFRDPRNNVISKLGDNPYAKVFFRLLNTRESCFNCNFKGNSCGADLVIGDFWGGKIHHPSFDDGNGVNAVLVLSEKGSYFWDSLKEIKSEPSTYEKVLERNPLIEKSVPRSESESKRFMSVYRAVEFEKAVNYALKGSLVSRIQRKGKTAVKIILRALGMV